MLVALLLKENLLVNKGGGAVAGAPFQYIDAGIAGEHFVLAAAEQGLGTCWIGWFDGRALLRHLNLKNKGYRSVCLFAVGYPERPPAGEPKRKPLSEIVIWNPGPE